MAFEFKPFHRNLMLGVAMAAALAACGNVKDWDLRNMGDGFSTSDAGRQATLNRPEPDSRGVISYPGYQVAVAQRGDTVQSVAQRLGLSPGDLARYNAIAPNTPLRQGAVLALPNRVAESAGGMAGTPRTSDGQVDISSLANGAINRAQASGGNGDSGISSGALPPPSGAPAAIQQSPAAANGRQPLRHKVLRGETAYSIARLYNVPVRSLAEWNGLGPDLAVHSGQILMIPLTDSSRTGGGATVAAAAPAVSAPGQPSTLPEPPSAAKPLPTTTPPPASAPVKVPASPDLQKDRTSSSSSAFVMPVDGKIIRAFSSKNKKDGIDIGAPAGSPVRASASGTVAKVMKTTDGVTVVLLKHAGNMATVYANVSGVKVSEGSSVRQGQTIATVASGSPSLVRFVVLRGFESVDPMSVVK